MRDKLIARLYQLRAESEDTDGDDPLDSELIEFVIHRDLTRHSDEELIEILECWGQFEG